jgi:hypothetical protein
MCSKDDNIICECSSYSSTLYGGGAAGVVHVTLVRHQQAGRAHLSRVPKWDETNKDGGSARGNDNLDGARSSYRVLSILGANVTLWVRHQQARGAHLLARGAAQRKRVEWCIEAPANDNTMIILAMRVHHRAECYMSDPRSASWTPAGTRCTSE